MNNVLRALVATAIFTGGVSCAAAEANDVAQAQWIIAISNDEAIHYAKFCGFYELRDLLTSTVQNLEESDEQRTDPVIEFRSLGYNGVTNILIGDSWVAIGETSASISPHSFNRIVDLVGNRNGQKVSKQRLDKKTAAILQSITDPAYREESGCPGYEKS